MDRTGARQPDRFDPARAARLDHPERERFLPLARIVALLDAPRGGTVVDFGAGTGADAIPLARLRPDLTVVAYDEQAPMLDLLRERIGGDVPPNLVVTGDVAAYAGAADRVLAVNVLHEIGDGPLARLGALLAPDGYGVVVDWRADVEREIGPRSSHVYREAEAVRRLEAAGYVAEPATEASLPYHYALRIRPSSPDRERRERIVRRLRELAGVRVRLETGFGLVEGFVVAGDLTASSVVVLIAERPGGDVARSVVLDLDAVSAIREASS